MGRPSVVQERTKQSVVITPELKVIVATDNGVIENGTERVGIDGLFVIDATSVARLLAALEGKVIQNVWVEGKQYITGASQIINDLNSEVKRLEAKCEETRNRHVEELSKVKNEYKKDNETIEEEKRNREKLEELKNSLNEEAGEEPDVAEKETQDKVNEESEPTGEVIGEQTKEEAIPLPGSSPLSHVANNLRSILRSNEFKSISAAGANDYSEETFRLHGNGEFLDVTITFSTCPKKE